MDEKIKVKDLATETGVSTKDLTRVLRELGVEVKSSATSIPAEIAAQAKARLQPDASAEVMRKEIQPGVIVRRRRRAAPARDAEKEHVRIPAHTPEAVTKPAQEREPDAAGMAVSETETPDKTSIDTVRADTEGRLGQIADRPQATAEEPQSLSRKVLESPAPVGAVSEPDATDTKVTAGTEVKTEGQPESPAARKTVLPATRRSPSPPTSAPGPTAALKHWQSSSPSSAWAAASPPVTPPR